MENTNTCPGCQSDNVAVNGCEPFFQCQDCGKNFRGAETCHICHQPVVGPWDKTHGMDKCTTPAQRAAHTKAEAANRGRMTDAEIAEDMGHYDHLYNR